MESSTRSSSPTRHMFSRFQSPPRSPPPSFGISIRRSSSPTRTDLWSSLAGSFSSSSSTPSSSSFSVRSASTAVTSAQSATRKKKTCMCSPTSHPGSFRCSYHRNMNNNNSHGAPSVSAALNMRRSAMVNSIVRIGSVEGNEMIRKALTTLIRPSSHHMRRRAAFNPRPSRLCHMTKG